MHCELRAKLAKLSAMKRFFVLLLLIVGGAGLYGLLSAPKTKTTQLASHRAMYDVRLSRLNPGGNLVNLTGLMVYEWRRDCDGWATVTRSTLNYAYADGDQSTINTEVTSHEAANGNEMSFHTVRESGVQVSEEIKGMATRTAKGVKVHYDLPENTPDALYAKDVLFPMQHTAVVLEHLRAGDKVFLAGLFDGTDTKNPQRVNALMLGDAKDEIPAAGDKHIDRRLIADTPRRIRFSFFKQEQEDEVADYEMDVRAHDNGVVTSAEIMYDSFSVVQRLKALEKLPEPSCVAIGKSVL